MWNGLILTHTLREVIEAKCFGKNKRLYEYHGAARWSWLLDKVVTRIKKQ